MAFPSRAEYEIFIYGLPGDNPEQIRQSTLKLYSVSALVAIVEGDVFFHNGLRLRVMEVVDFKASQIRKYSYEVWRGDEKILWYDPQPHPENPDLAATFPHHRHEPPEIKHNRKPAPGITFHTPNLPTLIVDSVELGNQLQAQP